MVHDPAPFRIVGRLPWRCDCPGLVYPSTQTTERIKSGGMVSPGWRYRILIWKFFAGPWNRILLTLQFLEYYGIFNRVFWRIGNGLWNTLLALACQRSHPGKTQQLGAHVISDGLYSICSLGPVLRC